MSDHVEAELISVEQAAHLLSIGRSRAYAMAASGEMPGVVRLGRSLRVIRRRLIAWIDEQAVPLSPDAGLER